jgi:uncharacterized radical SAM superfamily protein
VQSENKAEKLKKLEEELKTYKDKLAEKMKYFHGVKHESAASELKYSEIMVLRDMIAGLEREIKGLKS